MEYELHFQEGFEGETVVVAVDGTVVASFPAKTRMQTGLAHIEKLQLEPGQRLTLSIEGSNVSASSRVDSAHPFITANRESDRLILGTTESSPGYL